MAFDLFSPSSSSTKKRICEDQQLGDYDEDGANLKLSLAPPASYTSAIQKMPLLSTHRNRTLEDGPKRNETLCNACGLRYRRLDHCRKACLIEDIPMWYSKAIDR